MSGPYILAADIGATNTRLRLCEIPSGGKFNVIAQISVNSGSEIDIKTSIRDFASKEIERGRTGIQAAVIGLPGKVSKDRMSCAISYLDPDRYISFQDIFETLGIENGALYNDLECGTFGVRCLGSNDFQLLSGKRKKPGFRADRFVLGMPGSGFGVGVYISPAGVVPSEGGQIAAMIDPENEMEQHICQYNTDHLRPPESNRAPLTYSEFVCGGAITRIFAAIVERRAEPSEHRAIFAELANSNENQKPRSIAEWASSPDHFASRYAREGFYYYGRFFGRAMQSTSLVILPQAVYLGGSIAMTTVAHFKVGFEESFRSHGTHGDYLSQIPIQVIMNPELNLDGATHMAMLQARGVQ